MSDTNSQNNCIERIIKALKLRSNECMLKNGSIVIEPEKGKGKLVIEVDISRILKICNTKRFKFKNCIFKKPIKLQQITFKNILYFIDSTFEEEVDFSRSLFEKRVFFSESTFKKNASFEEVIFEQNAYFDEARFLGEADFSLSEFNKSAHFYGTYFDKFPNFIQAIFNENINFTNTELGFGFDGVKNKIGKTYNKRKEEYDKKRDKEDKKEPKKHKIANEFRDSFRNIKSLLIEHHNMLDASNYHRVELYCKELELEYKREEKAENSGIRDIVDRIQLYCYRVTSDHHTNLLLILNNVIILIACFGLTNFILNILLNQNYFDFSGQKVFMAIGAFFINGIFILMTLFLILNCWKGFSFSIDWLKNKLQAFKILKDSLNTKANTRTYLVLTSYCAMAIIFAVNPTLFLPILGQLLDSKLYIGFTFTSLNIAYAILMFLLIWSLQKTARKNTIVPN